LLALPLQLFLQPPLVRQPRFQQPGQGVQVLRVGVGQGALHQAQRAGRVCGLSGLGQQQCQPQVAGGLGVVGHREAGHLARQGGGAGVKRAVGIGQRVAQQVFGGGCGLFQLGQGRLWRRGRWRPVGLCRGRWWCHLDRFGRLWLRG